MNFEKELAKHELQLIIKNYPELRKEMSMNNTTLDDALTAIILVVIGFCLGMLITWTVLAPLENRMDKKQLENQCVGQVIPEYKNGCIKFYCVPERN